MKTLMLHIISVMLDNKKYQITLTMNSTLNISFLCLCIFSSWIYAQDLRFDEEGNVINTPAAPFNFHKLVASKVKGEDSKTTTASPPMTNDNEDHSLKSTEEAKSELRLLKGLYRRLLDSKDAGEKEKLRSQIMEKVEIIESILHKKKAKVTEEAVDYFTAEEGSKPVESIPEGKGKKAMASTTLPPLFEFDDMTVGPGRSRKEKVKGASSTTITTTSIASTTISSKTGTSTKMAEIELEKTYYPWESPKCKDEEDKETCQSFQHLCSMMPVTAYRRCRKTCQLCMDDKPQARILKASLNALSVNASIVLTQTNPDAPAFMTVCALIDDDIHTYSAVIHSFGEVAQNGKICQSFGPHYNPYGAQHGRATDSTKHVGDLGILEFGEAPEDWPEGISQCPKSQQGAYGMFDHINLFSETSPENRPVAIYSGEAPLHGFSSADVIACGKLARMNQ